MLLSQLVYLVIPDASRSSRNHQGPPRSYLPHIRVGRPMSLVDSCSKCWHPESSLEPSGLDLDCSRWVSFGTRWCWHPLACECRTRAGTVSSPSQGFRISLSRRCLTWRVDGVILRGWTSRWMTFVGSSALERLPSRRGLRWDLRRRIPVLMMMMMNRPYCTVTLELEQSRSRDEGSTIRRIVLMERYSRGMHGTWPSISSPWRVILWTLTQPLCGDRISRSELLGYCIWWRRIRLNRTCLGSEVKKENGGWVGNGFVSFHFFCSFWWKCPWLHKIWAQEKSRRWAPQRRNTSWQGQG